METVYEIENPKGTFSCDVKISSDEWLRLLHKEKSGQFFDTLICLLREPEQTATCGNLAKKYGEHPQFYVNKVTSFAKWTQKELGRFNVVDQASGEPTFWSIAMEKGWQSDAGFIWKMRPELAGALRICLLEHLVDKLRHSSKPFNGYEEAYKWELINTADGKDALSISQLVIGKNIIDNPRSDKVLKYLGNTKARELSFCLDGLFDESVPLDDRLAAFKTKMRELCPREWSSCANDERTASALLTCKYPTEYTFYQNEVYQLVCQYFGFTSKPAGHKYGHFLEILGDLTDKCGDEVQSIISKEIEQFNLKPGILAVQTMIWCLMGDMKKEMTNRTSANYWLVGYTYGGNDSQIERFFHEGIWDSWCDKDQLELASKIKAGDIIILKSTGTKGTGHKIPFLRIKGVGIVESLMIGNEENSKGHTLCRCKVKYINREDRVFEGKPFGFFRKTIHKADDKAQAIIDYANNLIFTMEHENSSKYQKYIDLLKENYNLVLTGAPGTGKTYMAKEIAKEMGCSRDEMCLVQFHPSYDYTDFVEGLRPVDDGNGQIVFERKDGVFKEFCKRAAKNLSDSAKSVEVLSKERSWKERLQQFIEEAQENNTEYELVNGNRFRIAGMKDRSIIVSNQNEKTARVVVDADEVIELLANDAPLNIVRDIRNYFERRFGTQADSYAFIIAREVKKTSPLVQDEAKAKIERKNYVFIIDEINRGEASKIFGELFYAIDPGYRADSAFRIKTQYQNLIPENDMFVNGFYVPENIYIIATMNDIDRSVESMDFAMRRRFSWKEITPDDTESMLDGIDCANEAKAAMHRVNDAIAKVDGLGPAYMIGPSYFLKLGQNGGDLNKLWDMNIGPLVREYLRGFRNAETFLKDIRNAYFATTEEDIEE